jgi:hypothetical protein
VAKLADASNWNLEPLRKQRLFYAFFPPVPTGISLPLNKTNKRLPLSLQLSPLVKERVKNQKAVRNVSEQLLIS